MKRICFFVAVIIMLIGAELAYAQIVLAPPILGSVDRVRSGIASWTRFHHWDRQNYYPGTLFNVQPELLVGQDLDVLDMWTVTYSSSSAVYFMRFRRHSYHGVLEFPLRSTVGGESFPTDQMTVYNWTAHFSGLKIIDGSGYLNLELFKMPESHEDGSINPNDFYEGIDLLSLLYSGHFDSSLPPFNPLDITERLRIDLFEGSSTDDTFGFVLIPGSGSGGTAKFSVESPIISINLISPTPTPSPTPTDTPTIALTATPTLPTATSIPSSTPTPGPEAGIRLTLSGKVFSANDIFKLRAICQGSNEIHYGQLCVALQVASQFFFWPSWSEKPELLSIILFPDYPYELSILDFIWPEGDLGMREGLCFWGILLDPYSHTLIGSIEQITFGYQ